MLPKDEIQKIFKSLKSPLSLSQKYNTNEMFIVDKDQKLRGRDDDENEIHYGYNASSVSELSNFMIDDVKVILAEYRLALKKYNENSSKK